MKQLLIKLDGWNCGSCGYVFYSWLQKDNHELIHHPISSWYDEIISENINNETADIEYSFNMDFLTPEEGGNSTRDVINHILNIEEE